MAKGKSDNGKPRVTDEDEIGTLGVNHSQGTRHGEKKGELLGVLENDKSRAERRERLKTKGKSDEQRI